jgi:hypothetical protein
MTQALSQNLSNRKAYLTIGPASGTGRAAALEPARHGKGEL